MKFRLTNTTKTAGLLLLAAFANPLLAETTTDYNSGWYLGGNIGIADANIDKDKLTQGLSNYTYYDEQKDLGYKLFGGYQFNKYFALEGGYFNLGQFDYELATPNGDLNGNIRVYGINLDAVGMLPLSDDFMAFARFGANYANAMQSYGTTGTMSVPHNSPHESNVNYKFGAGFEYALTDAIGFRLEAERYRIDDAIGNKGDIDLYSIGLVYRFGTTTTNSAPAAEEEICLIPVEEEEKKVHVTMAEAQDENRIKEAVAKEQTVVLTLADVNFKFDESELNDEAKDSLKKYIPLLNKNSKARVHLEGHTSAAGTDEYNQALSERRAQSVKDYLVKEKLFTEDKITTIGYGSTRPLQHEVDENDLRSEAAKANMRVILEVTQKELK